MFDFYQKQREVSTVLENMLKFCQKFVNLVKNIVSITLQEMFTLTSMAIHFTIYITNTYYYFSCNPYSSVSELLMGERVALIVEPSLVFADLLQSELGVGLTRMLSHGFSVY